MPTDRTSPPDPQQPMADDPLAGLRKLAALAKELGVSDVGTFADALETARNEGRGAELFKPLKALVEQYAGPSDSTKSFGELGARLKAMVSGSDTSAEVRSRAEVALLRRIEELSKSAPIDGLLDLATAYAQICASRTAEDAPLDRASGSALRK